MKKIAILLTIILPISACVTTLQTTADELAYFQKMETEMGLNRMNVMHDRSR
jgi:hypothetical protein